MSNYEEFNRVEVQTGESESYQARGEDHCGGGVHPSRLGSPHPDEFNNAPLRQTDSAVRDRTANQQIQNRASPSEKSDTRPIGPNQRPTLIRWAKNLPVSDRKLPPSSLFNEPTSSPDGRRAALKHSNSNSNIQDKSSARTTEHTKYLARQRAYVVGRNFEKSQKKRKADTVAKHQAIQSNEEDTTFVAAIQQAPAVEYIPPHKRSIKPKVKIEVEVPNQEQPSITSYYAESDTESTDNYTNPRPSLVESTKESTPLTPMALRGLPEKHGVANKSKKSHPSMDVSVDDEVTSSHEYDSSRLSDSFDKTAGSVPPGPISTFVHAWLNTLSADCVTSFLDEIENHHNYDVDPTNGQLLEKVEQPDTIVNIEEETRMKPAMLHRRRDWTSNLAIHREINVRKSLMRRQQEEAERERCNLPSQGQEPNENDIITNTIKPTMESISNKRKLLADCVLRPVQLNDAKGCAEIYNAAVADHDYQVVDTNPVSAQRFEFTIMECQREELPFVVATLQKVDLSDASNWPSQDAYRQYMKWKESQPKENEPTENSIYGFAYLKPYERGIGGLTGTASPVVKANVFVHPDHRRGGIGSALLHQLLTQTSILYYGNVVEYKWDDPTTGEDSFRTSDFRNVHRIIFHTMVKSEGSQSLKWMDNFMTSFQFENCGHLNQVYRVDTPHGAEWYDQVVWQHWANKVDSVRTLYVGDESECSYDYPGKSHSPGYRRVQSPVAGEELRCSSGYNNSDDVFGH
ncbi:hypothetical protein CI238_06210 [Colletotrichum incanum]|uniref:Uncharacterized protein n=1 Tax=Colletotrichum incanum TaxID=1573173 RepID=A0A166NUU7_COLIC|nr:hypothetical protein CI238_06210 [Colletotrichum incanum]OHW92141.1 acyl-n-acyltransferase [Colletotrichum incanum]